MDVIIYVGIKGNSHDWNGSPSLNMLSLDVLQKGNHIPDTDSSPLSCVWATKSRIFKYVKAFVTFFRPACLQLLR